MALRNGAWGSAVGQQPLSRKKITSWVMGKGDHPRHRQNHANIHDITWPRGAAKRAGATPISLINTINSITNVNLDTFVPSRPLHGLSSHGGYCGPAVKPIALNMLQACAPTPTFTSNLRPSAAFTTWRDAAEFIAFGATSLQVCTAVMHYGLPLVEDMNEGSTAYLDPRA